MSSTSFGKKHLRTVSDEMSTWPIPVQQQLLGFDSSEMPDLEGGWNSKDCGGSGEIGIPEIYRKVNIPFFLYLFVFSLCILSCPAQWVRPPPSFTLCSWWMDFHKKSQCWSLLLSRKSLPSCSPELGRERDAVPGAETGPWSPGSPSDSQCGLFTLTVHSTP